MKFVSNPKCNLVFQSSILARMKTKTEKAIKSSWKLYFIKININYIYRKNLLINQLWIKIIDILNFIIFKLFLINV